VPSELRKSWNHARPNLQGGPDGPQGGHDPGSNNLRVYVLTAATRAVYPLPGLARPSAGLAAVPSGPRGAKAVVRPPLPDHLVSWLTR
jgi:hypothetical protein